MHRHESAQSARARWSLYPLRTRCALRTLRALLTLGALRPLGTPEAARTGLTQLPQHARLDLVRAREKIPSSGCRATNGYKSYDNRNDGC